jgi:AcrR family transcriptional regulator
VTSTPMAPSNDEIRLEVDPVRRAILAGMQRVLLGQPKAVSVGATSFSDLAVEAGIARHHLYQTHPDLKDRFEFLRDRSDAPTLAESNLQKKVTMLQAETERLRDLQERTRDDARNWKALSETFERAINVLQEELRREQTTSSRLSARLARIEGSPGQAPVVSIRPRR